MKLVILDRDGVINYDSEQFIKSPEEWKPIPGSLNAIAKLNHAGYTVVVATNQSGIGRGLLDMSALTAIHEKLQKMLLLAGGKIDAFFYCPHTADLKCSCRKPEPGMLLEIASRFDVDLNRVPAIGDSLRDLVSARKVGAKPILVLTGKGQKTLENGGLPEGTEVYADLSEAVNSLVG